MVDPDELWEALLHHHREVFMPDLERLLDEELDIGIDAFGRTMRRVFAEMNRRFDRLDDLASETAEIITRIESLTTHHAQ